MRVASSIKYFTERVAVLYGEVSRIARSVIERLRPLVESARRFADRVAKFPEVVSRRTRSALETGPLADFLRRWAGRYAKFHAEASRIARKSPEGTGAAAGFVVSIALTLVMMGVGAHRVALAEKAAEEAKSIAAQEHPTQQEDTEPETTPEPAPEPAEAAATPGPKLPQMGKAFIERFDGEQLNEDRWYISDGWSNGDWMENDWRRSQISMTPEGLRITLERSLGGSKKLLAGGEVQTRELFRYGYFEVRMRVPRGEGLITGAFTYIGPEGRVRPNEIDVEILGKATRRIDMTIHEKGRSTGAKADLPFDSADGFYSYGFDWQPAYVRWYAEGVMIHEEKGSAARNLVRPQKFFLSQWGTKQLHQWAGELDASRGPWNLDIACVGYAPTYEGKPLCD